MKLTLLTIGISHYCEKARWALDRAGISYVEKTYAPILHYRATTWHRTRRTLPALLTPHGKILDSTDILHFVDRMASPAARLFPDDPALREDVERLESHFDERLGPATRRWAYSWGLHDRSLLFELMQVGLPTFERALLSTMAPMIVSGLTRGLGLSDEAIEKTEVRIAEVFDEVGGRLKDGRRYLVGDRFSAADLGFAALAAPAVMPREYGLGMPELARFPEDMRRAIGAMRSTAAGDFVLRIYRDHRREIAG